MRLLNILVIGALILAASFVYKIKFESTLQAERAAKLRGEIQRERDTIAALRAEWAKLESPARLEELARRHLNLRPAAARQLGDFASLPERPPAIVRQQTDPVGAMIEHDADTATGSIAPAR